MKTNYMEHGGAGAAWDSLPMIVAPPGTSLGAMAAQGMFAELSSALGLQVLGVYTPWATRSGDTVWEEIKNPDSNIAIWSITDAQVNAVPEIAPVFISPAFIGRTTKVSVSRTAKVVPGVTVKLTSSSTLPRSAAPG